MKTGMEHSNGKYLFLESIGEGIAFVAGDQLLSPIISNDYEKVFALGFGFHFLAEFTNLHQYYLTKCERFERF
jgi:hypothetical protein